MTFGKKSRGSVDASLFVQVAAVMAAAIIVAQVTNLLVLYYTPPPTPETFSVSEITRAYMGMPPPEGRPSLVVKKIDGPTLEEQPPGTGPTSAGAFGSNQGGPNGGRDGGPPQGGSNSGRDIPGPPQNGSNNDRDAPEVAQAPAAITPDEAPEAATGGLDCSNEGQGSRGFRREFIACVAKAGGPELEVINLRISQSFGDWFGDQPRFRLSSDQFGVFSVFNTNEGFLVAPFRVEIEQPDGSWVLVRNAMDFRLNPWQQRALWTFLISLTAVLITAYLFARRLTQPFTRLAEGAERLGRDPSSPALPIHGPSEARVASQAFNNMQERLRRYVEDRTAMIGAIAHDLRTPLTRLRFRIEGAVPDDLKAKIDADLDQMEEMISATLSFVRDATIEAKRTKLELSSVLETLADEMTETGSEVSVDRSEKVVIDGDPVALKRLFSNLMENAVKYGKRARVRVFRQDQNAIVEIDDDGPGVPESEMERVFDPFYRREPSRNRDTGGIGLGLAVVRTVARAHGGDAELVNRPGGGLTARVHLPL